jgi:phosphoglycerol transferase MdoB-like AlkP superfamily enzyme
LEDGLRDFKAEITERPLLYLAIAFIAGFVSRTFPVRQILSALRRLVFFLMGPAILLIGILKISELVSTANDE